MWFMALWFMALRFVERCISWRCTSTRCVSWPDVSLVCSVPRTTVSSIRPIIKQLFDGVSPATFGTSASRPHRQTLPHVGGSTTLNHNI